MRLRQLTEKEVAWVLEEPTKIDRGFYRMLMAQWNGASGGTPVFSHAMPEHFENIDIDDEALAPHKRQALWALNQIISLLHQEIPKLAI